MARKSEVKETVPTFTKEQILNSKTFGRYKDLLDATLIGGKTYTKEQVNNIINKFYGKVGK